MKRADRVKFLLLAGVLLCACAALYTWWEGRRFVPRSLTSGEEQIVLSALELGDSLAPCEALGELKGWAQSGQLQAMDEPSFARREERITVGYTDENGIIMLNPRICFAVHHSLGPTEPSLEDRIKTLSTLIHEYQHRTENAAESEAYEAEWAYLNRCLKAAPEGSELQRELQLWEAEMSERVRLYVGSTRWEQLKESWR